MNVDLYIHELPIDDQIKLPFWAAPGTVWARMPDGTPFSSRIWRYHSRADWPKPESDADKRFMFNRPPEFHAALGPISLILKAYHCSNVVTTDTADPILNVRQLIQVFAQRYNQDPNEISNQYKECRFFLDYPTLHHPETFDSLLNNIKLKQTNMEVKQ